MLPVPVELAVLPVPVGREKGMGFAAAAAAAGGAAGLQPPGLGLAAVDTLLLAAVRCSCCPRAASLQAQRACCC